MTQICGGQVAPAHGQWRKLVETASQSQDVKLVCALRLSQPRAPDSRPTSPWGSRMMCE